MAKSRFSAAEYGFNKRFCKTAVKVWFYIPLIIIFVCLRCGFMEKRTIQTTFTS